MKKLLHISQYPDDGTAFYRSTPLKYIDGKDISVTFQPMIGQIGWNTFIGYTHLLLTRPSSHNDLAIIKLAKDCGLKVISDYDDDVLHVDQYNPTYHIYEAAKGLILDCLMLSDEIWVTTAGLKKAFGMYNQNIHIIPNSLNDYLFKVKDKRPFNSDTRKAFWRGGGSHQADVYECADDLIKVVNENANWVFNFIGERFIYLEQRCGINYQPVSQMSLMQYFKYLNNENPNIMFAPLSTTKFNQSKSNISWIEATYAGAAFFGNIELPEFSNESIFSISLLQKGIDFEYGGIALEQANKEAWELIKDNLLLSKVNELRKERILS